ncbi:interleukin-6 [Ambystoma mexicanum]|uniref:interleukin-6 n=1 Tax=Ambystoma mexicanum TaxID=8296 RepID=UPI0037E74FB6
MALSLRTIVPILTQLRFLALALSLALSLALLVPSIHASPVPDSSGEEEPSDARQETPKYESLALLIQSEAALLKEELCTKHFVCDNSMESLLENNLNLPKINREDGCFKQGFRKEKCLRKITNSLLGFETYLSYVEETMGIESKKVESIKYKTKHLTELLLALMRKPNAEGVTPGTPGTPENRQTRPQAKDTWTQKVTARLILRDFILFIQKTVRAVRFLSTSGARNGSLGV